MNGDNRRLTNSQWKRTISGNKTPHQFKTEAHAGKIGTEKSARTLGLTLQLTRYLCVGNSASFAVAPNRRQGGNPNSDENHSEFNRFVALSSALFHCVGLVLVTASRHQGDSTRFDLYERNGPGYSQVKMLLIADRFDCFDD